MEYAWANKDKKHVLQTSQLIHQIAYGGDGTNDGNEGTGGLGGQDGQTDGNGGHDDSHGMSGARACGYCCC